MSPSDYMNPDKKYNKVAQNFQGFELSKKKKNPNGKQKANF